ncbi:spore coat associated protein CotJA [Lacrimispora brassicae]
MAYVPWQRWQQVYSVDVAISVGTIFPDLNKPFIMGGCQ